MDENLVIEKIKSSSQEGKITCHQALKIAEEMGVPSRKIGALLNKLKIKLVSCQLGCFK